MDKENTVGYVQLESTMLDSRRYMALGLCLLMSSLFHSGGFGEFSEYTNVVVIVVLPWPFTCQVSSQCCPEVLS